MKLSGMMLSPLLWILMISPTTAQVDSQSVSDDIPFSQPLDDARYSGLTTYLIEMKDGNLIPTQLVVPAKTKFRLVVRNVGSKPAEFESNQLRQEKVLFMGADANVVITPLDPGSYDYFDDFAPGINGKIVAK